MHVRSKGHAHITLHKHSEGMREREREKSVFNTVLDIVMNGMNKIVQISHKVIRDFFFPFGERTNECTQHNVARCGEGSAAVTMAKRVEFQNHCRLQNLIFQNYFVSFICVVKKKTETSKKNHNRNMKNE